MIDCDKETYDDLKAHYQKAVKEEKMIFIFKEQEIVTSYGKYLLEYMRMKLGIPNE